MMRRIAAYLLPLLLLVAAAVAIPGTSIAGDTPATDPKRTLDVVGHGTITAKPDTAMITLGASSLKETPTAAYNDVAKILTRVTASLGELGVKEDDLQTQELNLGAEYNWTQDKGQVLKGYRVSTNITITTQKLDSIAALVEAAVDAGANQLQSISFTIKDTESLADQAMDVAVANARSKAERVAKGMNVEIIGVVRVSVMDQTPGPIIRAAAPMAAKEMDSVAMPVFSGANKIQATVSATFEIR